MKIDRISTGICGEYFVAAELIRHGYTIALTNYGIKHFDILAINRETNKQIAVQVKTTFSGDNRWMIEKADIYESKDAKIYYFFVHLNEMGTPRYFIIPNDKLAEYFNKEKNERKIDFSISSDYEKYEDAWEQLI